MEDVDKVILRSLETLGWESEDPSSTLKDLEPSDVASGIIACLKVVRNDLNVPDKLPVSIAQRFKTAGSIAEMIKELDYPEDIGYQTILYPNESELRKLFMYLIERLPKDAPTITEDVNDRLSLIQKEARQKLRDSFKIPWIPPHCQKALANQRRKDCDNISLLDQSYTGKGYNEDGSSQMKGRSCNAISDLLEKHSQQMSISLGKSELVNYTSLHEPSHNDSQYSQIPALLSFPESESVLKFLESRKQLEHRTKNMPTDLFGDIETPDCLEELQMKADVLSEELNGRKAELEKINKRNNEIKNYTTDLTGKLEKMEKNVETIRKFESITTSYDDAKNNLEAAVKSSNAKELKRKNQWKEYKETLEQEIQDLQTRVNSESTASMENEMNKVARQTKLLAMEIANRETFAEKIEEEIRKNKNQVSRSSYTQKIVDISGKVRRHKQQTQKVISDIKIVQKDINNLTGKLQRTFSRVESECYSKAIQDERLAPVYEYIVGIHEKCGELVEIIRETGSVQREIANLTLQVDTEDSKKLGDKIKTLQKDMERMKQEQMQEPQKV